MRAKTGSEAYFAGAESALPFANLFGSGTQNCTTKRARAAKNAAVRKTMLKPKASIINPPKMEPIVELSWLIVE